MNKYRFVMIISMVIITTTLCSNCSHLIKGKNNKNEIVSEYKADSVSVTKLFVSDTSLFSILDELIAYAEKNVPEFKKNSDAVFFEFATHLQNYGIYYKVSLRGLKSFIVFSGEHNIYGAFYYKNVLFIIRKNFNSSLSPFSTTDEKMTLYTTRRDFLTIYEMGNIEYKDNKYLLNLCFSKYVPMVK